VSRLKRYAVTTLAAVYLTSLWVYQLPESRVERALMVVFRPVQKLMLTDRMYRMYAPDPRTVKWIPFLELKTDQTPVRFWKAPYGFLSREKWANFLDNLSKALRGEQFFLSEDEGRSAFQRLAQRICNEESTPTDRVRRVTLKSRRVEYGEFRGDIVWDAPEDLGSFSCP
jgi:hypothetical protein